MAKVRDTLSVQLFDLDRIPIDAAWNTPNVRSSYWRIYHNDRDGAAVKLSDGSTVPLPGNAVHLIPAWVRFDCHCRPGPGERIDHLYAHFDLIGLPSRVVEGLFPRPQTLPRDDLMMRTTQAVAQAVGQGGVWAVSMAKAWIDLAMARLIAGLNPGQRDQLLMLSGQARQVSAAIAYIEGRLDGELSNAQLARQCHMSEDHFIRRFRAAVGQTPAQFVLSRRLHVAAQRLTFTDDTIDRVASDLGFANRYHFSRAFKRVMGLPPATYRLRARHA